MNRIFDVLENRWIPINLDSEVRLEKFRSFVDFVLTNFKEFQPITAKDVVKINGCPVEDEETASKYLSVMMREGLHLKTIYTHGKVYFLGCTPEQSIAFKRIEFEGWAGTRIEAFLENHPRVGRIVFERIYRYREYGEPPFPVLSRMFNARDDACYAR